MCNKGFLKRMLPFFATFALGIFIASFFVSVGPRFGFGEKRMHRFQEMQRLQLENEELREENLRLKTNHQDFDPMELKDEGSTLDGSRILRISPPPPPAPRVHR